MYDMSLLVNVAPDLPSAVNVEFHDMTELELQDGVVYAEIL